MSRSSIAVQQTYFVCSGCTCTVKDTTRLRYRSQRLYQVWWTTRYPSCISVARSIDWEKNSILYTTSLWGHPGMLGLPHEREMSFLRRSCIGPSWGWTSARALLPLGRLFFIWRSEAHSGGLKIYLPRGATRVVLSLLFDYMQPYDSRTRAASGIDRNKGTFTPWRCSHSNLSYPGDQKRTRFSDTQVEYQGHMYTAKVSTYHVPWACSKLNMWRVIC